MVLGEKTLTGVMAIRLIEHPDFPELNIFNASFNEGSDKSLDEEIISFKDGFIITTKNRYGLKIFYKEDAELIFPEPSAKLLALINSLKSVGEKRQETVDNHLAAIGYPINLGGISLEEKEFIWSLVNADVVPSASYRSTFFELAKKSTNLNWCIRFFKSWLLDLEKDSKPEPIGRMHLAFVLRQTGMFKQALQVTNVVEFPRERFNCPPNIMAILATIRAAIYLDIFERVSDKEHLYFARKTVNKAWAKNQSDEASNVYQRLQKFERLIETQEYKQKVDQAYLDWADWN